MPSSYTPSLRLTLPVTGELSGTWGNTVNTGITNLLDSAVAGTAAVTMTDADYTLTSVNGATDEARKMFVTLTGTLTAARNVICPSASKLYFIRNTTTGGFAVTLKTSAGTGISVPNGKSMVLYCNGTDVIDATNHYSSITIATALAATSGGTGQASYTTGDLLYASSSTALSKLGVGTAGQVLTSSGTAPQWTTISGVAVTTFSAGTTGFTPSTATSGAVTLAGTLATTNGGTGLTSFTSGGVVYASSSSALATGSALTFDGTTFSAPFVAATAGFFTSTNAGTAVRLGASSQINFGAGGSDLVLATNGANIRFGDWNTNTEQMRLTSTGLGIGTSSPGAKLDVNGDVNIAAASGASLLTVGYSGTSGNHRVNVIGAGVSQFSGYYLNGAPSLVTNTSTSATLQIGSDGTSTTFQTISTYTNGAVRTTLDSSGNLGIGTSSPGYMLDVSGAGRFNSVNTGAAPQLLVGDWNTVSNPADIYMRSTGLSRFLTGSGGSFTWGISGSSEFMRLDASGNLGLGVTPSAWSAGTYRNAFQIGLAAFSGSPATDVVEVSSNQYINSAGNRIYMTTGNPSTFYQQAAGAHIWLTAPSGTAGNAISFTQAMTLDTSGNLGIGTTSPFGKLDVNGTISTSASGTASILFRTSGTTNYSWANQYPSAGNFSLYDHGLATSVLTVNAGNLGIGTSSPTFKLDVAGNIKATGTIRTDIGSGVTGQSFIGTGGSSNIQFTHTVSDSQVQITNSGGGGFLFNSTIGAATGLNYNASGNLGLGVTPSAWVAGAVTNVLQFYRGSVGSLGAGPVNHAFLAANAYATGSGDPAFATWKYVSTGAAQLLEVGGANALTVKLAGSGTADTAISFTQAMTLDASGNLGIGTATPSAKLHVYSGVVDEVARFEGTGSPYISLYDTNVRQVYLYAQSTKIDLQVDVNKALAFGTNSTERMRLDASGNLGLGVIPSAWGTASPYRSLDIGAGSSFVNMASNTDTRVVSNAYYNGTNWIYKNTAAATYYKQALGEHSWFNAPSGTAAGTITFTQAMTLDANGNLGIGVASNSWPTGGNLLLANTGGVISNGTTLNSGTNYYFNSGFKYVGTGKATQYYHFDGGHYWTTAPSGTAGNAISFTQAMTLDASGNLTVGATGGEGVVRGHSSADGTIASFRRLGSTYNTGLFVGNVEATQEVSLNASGSGGVPFFTFKTSNTERMRLDASGNLGLGATPSAWSGFTALQIKSGGASLWSDGAQRLFLSSNLYYNGTNRIYETTGFASEYHQTDGRHLWYTAPSGTAGNAITFTQAMTLDANGNLFVGRTSAFAQASKLVIEGNSSTTAICGIFNDARTDATSAINIAFYRNGTKVGSVDCTNAATAYVTSSDRRLKENIKPAQDSGAVVDAIEIVEFDWKVGGHTDFGVIAQDLNEVYPNAVSVGDTAENVEESWGVDYSKLVPMLIKEIQSLRARVAQLESK